MVSAEGKYDRPVLQSAERTLRVLQLLSQRGALTLTEAAHELDAHPSVAHRLLSTLVAMDFARQDSPGDPYTTGAALHELSLGASRAISLRAAGATTLEKARRALSETVSIVVLEGRMIRFVETLEGEGVIRVAAPIGKTFAAHTTAGGRALLAQLSEDDLLRRYPTRTLPRVPSSRVRTWEDLVTEMRGVRSRGWASQVGEADDEILAVAFAVVDSLGSPAAALCVTVPRARYPSPEAVAGLAHALEPFARTIQRRLRGSR